MKAPLSGALSPSAGRARRLGQRYIDLLGYCSVCLDSSTTGLTKVWSSREVFAGKGRRYWVPSGPMANSLCHGVRVRAQAEARERKDHLRLGLQAVDGILKAVAIEQSIGLTPHTEFQRSVLEFIADFEVKVDAGMLRTIATRYRIHKLEKPDADYGAFLEQQLGEMLKLVVRSLW